MRLISCTLTEKLYFIFYKMFIFSCVIYLYLIDFWNLLNIININYRLVIWIVNLFWKFVILLCILIMYLMMIGNYIFGIFKFLNSFYNYKFYILLIKLTFIQKLKSHSPSLLLMTFNFLIHLGLTFVYHMFIINFCT